MKGWLTCTPKSFDGGPSFFTRDSGLLCRGLQKHGIVCFALMPLGKETEDEPDLLRTEYHNLESVDWWISQKGIEGVLLYSWASPQYRKVAQAIRAAGLFLVVNLDNSGLLSPMVGFREWFSEQWILSGKGKGTKSWIHFFKLVLKGASLGLLYTDPMRAIHLKQADVIACVSPIATARIKKLCGFYGGKKMAEKVRLIPHSVESQFGYFGGFKQRQIVCVGRWDDEVQKRTSLLCESISHLLGKDLRVSVVIIGKQVDFLTEWHSGLEESHQARVRLAGVIPRAEMAQTMRESEIFYSPSAFESFGIAAAEALCCGCSVVAERSVSMAAFDWFVAEEFGMLAECSRASHHAEILCMELALWDKGARNAGNISNIWCQRLHEYRVAGEVLTIFQEARG